MSSFAAPSSQKAPKSLNPKYRQKSALLQRIIRHYPYLLNPLIPKPVFGISTPSPNPLHQAVTSSTLSLSSAALPPKLVRLQLSFNIRQDGVPRGPANVQEVAEVRTYFHPLFQIGYYYPFLVVGVTDLPAKPWPTSIANVPLGLTITPSKLPFMIGVISRGFNIC